MSRRGTKSSWACILVATLVATSSCADVDPHLAGATDGPALSGNNPQPGSHEDPTSRTPPIPSGPLTITRPAAGVPWARGTLHWLTWRGDVAEASFEVSTDGGKTWTVPPEEPEGIEPRPVAPNRRIWKVPDDAPSTILVRAVTPDRELASEPATLTVIPSQEERYVWSLKAADADFTPRDGAGLQPFDGRLLLLGGWNVEEFEAATTNEIWASEDDGATWKLESVAPWEPRHTFGDVVLGGKLLVVGGDTMQGWYQPDVWATSDGKSWQQLTDAAPWGQRVLHHTTVHDGAVWVMGGQTLPEALGIDEPVKHFSDVWRSTDGASWTKVLDN